MPKTISAVVPTRNSVKKVTSLSAGLLPARTEAILAPTSAPIVSVAPSTVPVIKKKERPVMSITPAPVTSAPIASVASPPKMPAVSPTPTPSIIPSTIPMIKKKESPVVSITSPPATPVSTPSIVPSTIPVTKKSVALPPKILTVSPAPKMPALATGIASTVIRDTPQPKKIADTPLPSETAGFERPKLTDDEEMDQHLFIFGVSSILRGSLALHNGENRRFMIYMIPDKAGQAPPERGKFVDITVVARAIYDENYSCSKTILNAFDRFVSASERQNRYELIDLPSSVLMTENDNPQEMITNEFARCVENRCTNISPKRPSHTSYHSTDIIGYLNSLVTVNKGSVMSLFDIKTKVPASKDNKDFIRMAFLHVARMSDKNGLHKLGFDRIVDALSTVSGVPTPDPNSSDKFMQAYWDMFTGFEMDPAQTTSMIKEYANYTFAEFESDVKEYAPLKMLRDFMIIFYNVTIMTSVWTRSDPAGKCPPNVKSNKYLHCFVPINLQTSMRNMLKSYVYVQWWGETIPFPNINAVSTGNIHVLSTYHPPHDPLLSVPDKGRPLTKIIIDTNPPTTAFILYTQPGLTPQGPHITITLGDIVKQQKWLKPDKMTVIVNAANPGMQGGGGVDGAIHQAASYLLSRYNTDHKVTCPEGTSVVTPPFNLSENGYINIIHTVGPHGKNPDMLVKSYRSVLDAALQLGAVNVAIPIISGEIFAHGWPITENTKVAIGAIVDWMVEFGLKSHIHEIKYVLLPSETAKKDALMAALENLTTTRPAT